MMTGILDVINLQACSNKSCLACMVIGKFGTSSTLGPLPLLLLQQQRHEQKTSVSMPQHHLCTSFRRIHSTQLRHRGQRIEPDSIKLFYLLTERIFPSCCSDNYWAPGARRTGRTEWPDAPGRPVVVSERDPSVGWQPRQGPRTSRTRCRSSWGSQSWTLATTTNSSCCQIKFHGWFLLLLLFRHSSLVVSASYSPPQHLFQRFVIEQKVFITTVEVFFISIFLFFRGRKYYAGFSLSSIEIIG